MIVSLFKNACVKAEGFDKFMISFSPNRWDLESIFQKNILSIVFLLLDICKYFTREGKIKLLLPRRLDVDVIRREYQKEPSYESIPLIKLVL